MGKKHASTEIQKSLKKFIYEEKCRTATKWNSNKVIRKMVSYESLSSRV